MTTPLDRYSATASLAGYLYQIRYALLGAARRARVDPDFTVSIETLDDVAFESGHAVEVLQLKHKIGRRANLTDASSDLWKTIGIWIDTADPSDPDARELYLVTTATAQPNSAASFLRLENRNVERARQLLATVTKDSENFANQTHYKRFTGLGVSGQNNLLNRITVLDRQPNLGEILEKLQEELRWSARGKSLDALIERLEGWWFGVCIGHLIGGATITGDQVVASIEDLSSQVGYDNLPLDDIVELCREFGFKEDDESHLDRIFVQQLRLISHKHPFLLRAVRDWMHTYTQRSKWLRDQLISSADLNRYDNRLFGEWDYAFIEMEEELDGTSDEEKIVDAGRKLLKGLSTSAFARLRDRLDAPHIQRGSLNMLADQRRVGWHLHYQSRLDVERGRVENR